MTLKKIFRKFYDFLIDDNDDDGRLIDWFGEEEKILILILIQYSNKRWIYLILLPSSHLGSCQEIPDSLLIVNIIKGIMNPSKSNILIVHVPRRIRQGNRMTHNCLRCSILDRARRALFNLRHLECLPIKIWLPVASNEIIWRKFWHLYYPIRVLSNECHRNRLIKVPWWTLDRKTSHDHVIAFKIFLILYFGLGQRRGPILMVQW